MAQTYFQKMVQTAQNRLHDLQERQSHLPAIITALEGVGNNTAAKMASTYTDELAAIPGKIAEVEAVIVDLND